MDQQIKRAIQAVIDTPYYGYEQRGNTIVIHAYGRSEPVITTLAGPQPESLAGLTVAQLKVLAGESGIEGVSSMKKAELISALEANQETNK